MKHPFRWLRAALVLVAAASSAGLGGCPRPEDVLEPNNTTDAATRLTPGVPVEARVVQGNTDVFVVSAGPKQTLVFDLESIGDEEDCGSFLVLGPDGEPLYADTNTTCGRVSQTPPPFVQPGGQLDLIGDGAYRLTIHADAPGDYFLIIVELGEVDNIFTFSWRYRLTATIK